MSEMNRQSTGPMNRRTTVVNRVNPHLQAQKRKSYTDNFGRRLLKCQAWKVEHLEHSQNFVHSTMAKNRILSSFTLAYAEFELFCPACDIYFACYDDYQDHVIFQSYIAPYEAIIRHYSNDSKIIRSQKAADKIPSSMTAKSSVKNKQRISLDQNMNRSTPQQPEANPIEYKFAGERKIYSEEYELQKLRDTKKKCVKLMKRMEKQAVDMDKIRHRRMTMVLNKRLLENVTIPARSSGVKMQNVNEMARQWTSMIDKKPDVFSSVKVPKRTTALAPIKSHKKAVFLQE